MQQFQDSLSLASFGITKAQAHQQQICVDCKKPISEIRGGIWSEREGREYQISGTCPDCWDKMFKE
jgi:predicted amidophosphoribosyltransferase